jgi:hypothetical protein
MDGLRLSLNSFAEMTSDRAAAVGRAFDAHPTLRPIKVGGDPARITVGLSLEAVIRDHGLPVEWQTVRRNGRYPDLECGSIDLLPGRGKWFGTPLESPRAGQYEYLLVGHDIEQDWLPVTMESPGSVSEAAALFEELALAIDASYGFVAADSALNSHSPNRVTADLPGVFWLNYFGPAFVVMYPHLAEQDGARVLSTGGVLIKTTALPWRDPTSPPPPGEARLASMFGRTAFQFARPNLVLPTVEQHILASPGTGEMPWETWQSSRDVAAQGRKYESARRRLAKALTDRSTPVLAPNSVEWSTSLDRSDWPDFVTHIARRVRGDLAGTVGRAVAAIVVNSPVGHEQQILIDTNLGAVQISWYVEDVTTVEVRLLSSSGLVEVCETWSDL